jgi:hypothetical protein
VHPTHYGRICPIETPEGPNIGLINSLATHARVNKYGFIESPYRKVSHGKPSTEIVYLVGDGRGEAQDCAGQRRDRRQGKSLDDLVQARESGEAQLIPRDEIESDGRFAEAGCFGGRRAHPFLENDDANRALMGSNMQQQAVPLSRTEAPIVGTGMEARLRATRARLSTAAPHGHRRASRCDTYRHPRDGREGSGEAGRRHLSPAEVPALEPEHLHQPASAGTVGDVVKPATSSLTARRRTSASWRSAATCSSRSCRGTATTTKTRS